jgi:hypothetical protein
VVFDDQDPGHAVVVRTGRAVAMIPEPEASALLLLKQGHRILPQHGQIIAHAAVTAR